MIWVFIKNELFDVTRYASESEALTILDFARNEVVLWNGTACVIVDGAPGVDPKPAWWWRQPKSLPSPKDVPREEGAYGET